MRLSLSFHELKHFFSKSSSKTKSTTKAQRHYLSTKKTTSSPSPYHYHRRSTDPASREYRATMNKVKGGHGPFYQLEELKLAETTSQWEMATLEEMMMMPSTETKTTRPIKTKLEALALQRHIMKSCHRREMADEAYMETLHIQQQTHPFAWPLVV
ncbi:hypothetical protein BC941DRAFT_411619 [Chlamydoabsidia padenii]|nr:hypothetical protein BC941DRAFT_411619 [Chlamydoabsidia padenii]